MRNRTSDLTNSTKPLIVDSTPQFPRRSHLSIAVPELNKLVDEFLLDCQLRQLTAETVRNYRNQFGHLFWFLEQRGMDSCGTPELKQFLHYLQEPPGDGGRWGKAYLIEPMRPQTAKDYHVALRRLFNWMVEEEIVPVSPMQRVPAPVVRTGLKQPLRPEQVDAMIKAARHSAYPERNTAILLFLFDTGLRAAELCNLRNLRMKDLDFKCRQAKVVGKGNKVRMCYWGLVSAKALFAA